MITDPWVLSLVRYGYRLEFTTSPPATGGLRVTPLLKETLKRDALLKELEELLLKRPVVRVHKRTWRVDRVSSPHSS